MIKAYYKSVFPLAKGRNIICACSGVILQGRDHYQIRLSTSYDKDEGMDLVFKLHGHHKPYLEVSKPYPKNTWSPIEIASGAEALIAFDNLLNKVYGVRGDLPLEALASLADKRE